MQNSNLPCTTSQEIQIELDQMKAMYVIILIQKASQPSLFDKVFVRDINNHSKRQRNCRK